MAWEEKDTDIMFPYRHWHQCSYCEKNLKDRNIEFINPCSSYLKTLLWGPFRITFYQCFFRTHRVILRTSKKNPLPNSVAAAIVGSTSLPSAQYQPILGIEESTPHYLGPCQHVSKRSMCK
ncbi:hypothetical protein XENTR_v10009287 [Xenopus tropicalis]|nr:hypothetical protein XENTR_v10009287 [Xenopus tropicalis]